MELELHALIREHRSIAMLSTGQMAMDREDALQVLGALIELLQAEAEPEQALEAAKARLVNSTNE